MDPEKFTLFIKDNYELRKTAKQFPDHAEALIQHVLMDPEKFTLFIKDNYDLRETAKQFSQYNKIFGCSDIASALRAASTYKKEVISSSEIRAAARLLYQAKHAEGSLSIFTKLPTELLVCVASFATQYPKVHSRVDAEKLASDNFSRPPVAKK